MYSSLMLSQFTVLAIGCTPCKVKLMLVDGLPIHQIHTFKAYTRLNWPKSTVHTTNYNSQYFIYLDGPHIHQMHT